MHSYKCIEIFHQYQLQNNYTKNHTVLKLWNSSIWERSHTHCLLSSFVWKVPYMYIKYKSRIWSYLIAKLKPCLVSEQFHLLPLYFLSFFSHYCLSLCLAAPSFSCCTNKFTLWPYIEHIIQHSYKIHQKIYCLTWVQITAIHVKNLIVPVSALSV